MVCADEFRDGLPKSVVVSKTIDTVRQLILQDRHVTFRDIVAVVGPAYIQYCMNIWLPKKFCSRGILHNLSIDQKKAHID